MGKLPTIRIVVLVFCLFLPGTSAAVEASVSASVSPQQSKVIRLKNLPANATLQVKINSNGKLIAALYHESDIKKQAGNSAGVFNSKFDRRISFSLKIEKAGHYYLILKNQSGSKTINANIAFTAESDPAISKAKTTLLKFEYALSKYIEFNKFPIKIIECRNSSLSVSARKTVLCAEHIKYSSLALKDRDDISDYLFYALLHLAGHQILAQWGLDPVDESEVNEFTITMLFLLNRQEQTRAVIDDFVRHYDTQRKINSDALINYHIPDAAQLKQLSDLLEGRSLTREWQQIMIPHISSNVLQKLASQPVDWIDQALIKNELTIRTVRTSTQQDDIQF